MNRVHFFNDLNLAFSPGESSMRDSDGARSTGNNFAEKNQNGMGPPKFGSSFLPPL